MRSALCLGLMLAAAPALAEDWPPRIGAELAERRAHCRESGGEARIAGTFLRRIDLDGDGRDDFVMDDAGFRCSKGTPLHCGSGGCQVQVFLGGETDARPVFAELAQKAVLKGRVLELSQRRGMPAIVVRFERGCAIRSDGERTC